MLSQETLDAFEAAGIREDICASCDRDLITVVRDGRVERTSVAARASNGGPLCGLCAASVATN